MAKLHQFLSIRDKELRRKLTPDYDFGCKRPTLSNSYYRTFNKPHVHLRDRWHRRIEPDGIVARDGTKRIIDTLVLATGFDVWEANLPAIEVIGRRRSKSGKVVAGEQVPGVRRDVGAGVPELLDVGQPIRVGRHVVVQHGGIPDAAHESAVRRTTAARCRTFEITEEANARFLDRMTRLLDDSVFYLGNCASSRSYWFNHSGEAPLFRPTSMRSAVKEQDRFPLSDYAIA